MTLLLGCIADDFTGATDLANNLVRAGMRVVQSIGVPAGPVDAGVDAVVVALKSRTIAPADAVAQSLQALQWLRGQGPDGRAPQIYFKYCSTFDSTPQGNIGPVAEALMDALGDEFSRLGDYLSLMAIRMGPRMAFELDLPPALAKALANGEVDAISVWEPWGRMALKLGGEDVVEVDTPRLYSQSFNLTVRNEYRLSQARRASAVLAALNEAIQFIKKNPDEAKGIMARKVGIDSETVKAAWPTYQFELTLQQSLLSTVQGQARWARREGHVGAALPEPEFLNFVDSSLLRKIKPNAVDFVYP